MDVLAHCKACGEPVSVTDEGGVIGAGPHWHYRASCLLEAARYADEQREGAVEALATLRREFAECADWAENYDGEIAGRMRDILASTATGGQ